MAKKKVKKVSKKYPQSIAVKLPSNMPFDEAMERLVKVKPPKKKDVQ